MVVGESIRTAAENLEVTASGRGGTFDTLRIRNFRIFWLGNLAGFFAMQMQAPAQAWLAYEITGSALKLGLVSAAWALPICLFSVFSGVFIDRFQKRNLLLISQIGTTILMLAVGILISTGLIQYWHLLLAAFFNGTLASFAFPTSQSLVPELVPRNKLFNAIAMNTAAFNVSRVAGPAISGMLIGFGGTASAYFVAVGFYLVATFLICLLPLSQKVAVKVGRSIKKELAEGFRYLKVHNILLALMGMEVVFAILGMPFQTLMPVFANLFKVSAFGYGMLMAITGIGALIGSLGVASFSHRIKGKGRFLMGSGIVFGVFLIVFATSTIWGPALGLGSATVFAASLMLLMIGVANTGYTSTSSTLIQLRISDDVRGRVNGIYGMVIGVMPLGVLPTSALADSIGTPFAVAILGVLMAGFMGAMFLFARRVRKLE